MAESYAHVLAILATLDVLQRYLEGQQAIVLANQYLYYAQGFPRLRVAPDVMVVLDVEPGERDSYKIWEEGVAPAVVFEMTSPGTKNQDLHFKFELYAQLGVQEYWLFDPKGEHLKHKLQGFTLNGIDYDPIGSHHSAVLNLDLRVEQQSLRFYRSDMGEKLLLSAELVEAREAAEQQARAEAQAREAAEQQAAEAQSKVEALQAKLRELGVDPDAIA